MKSAIINAQMVMPDGQTCIQTHANIKFMAD